MYIASRSKDKADKAVASLKEATGNVGLEDFLEFLGASGVQDGREILRAMDKLMNNRG